MVIKTPAKKALKKSEEKPMRLSKVRAIGLDQIGVDSVLFAPAVPTIFDFKRHVEDALIRIVIGNSDVSMQ